MENQSTKINPEPNNPNSRVGVTQSPSPDGSFGVPINSLADQPVAPLSTSPPRRLNIRWLAMVGVIAVVLASGSFWLYNRMAKHSGSSLATDSIDSSGRFSSTSVPLTGLGPSGNPATINQKLTVNGLLELNQDLLITPGSKPIGAVAGQIYYDQTTNKLSYYNGTSFVSLGGASDVVASIGGAKGDVTLGNNLSINNGQLNVTGLPPATGGGVTSLQGQSGAVTLSSGAGIGINGTRFTNTGVLSLDGATGNVGLGAGAGIGINGTTISNLGVTSLSGTANQISVSAATGALTLSLPQNIDTGATPSFAAIDTNSITPSGPLTIGSNAQSLALDGSTTSLSSTSGANTTSLTFATPTANVTYQLQTATPGTYNVCTTAGNCSGVGGGVTSPGGTIGQLARFSASQTIVSSIISDNGTNATVAGGLTVNNTLTANTITPTSTLTIGTSGQALALQGNGTTTLAASAGGFTNTLSFATPAGSSRAIVIPNASGTVAVAASGNIALDSAGTVSFSGILPVGNGGTGGSAAPTAGSVAYGNGSAYAFTAAGSAGQILTSAGAAAPSFTNLVSLLANGANINLSGTTSVTIATVNNPSFSTSVTTPVVTSTGSLTVGNSGQALTLQGNSSTSLTATGGGFTTTIGFTNSPSGAVTYNFDRSATPGTYAVCTTAGNCVGSGGGVTTPGGTPGKLAKFTGSQAIADSIISESGTTVTVAGSAVLQGTGSLTLGTASASTGSIAFKNSANNNTVTLQSGTTGATNPVFNLPTADGSANDCLKTNGAGQWAFAACTGGAGGGVTSVNSLSGTLSVQGTPNQITVASGGSTITLSTPQDINTISSPSFAGETITGASGLTLGTGTTAGKLVVRDGASAFTSTIQTAAFTASRTITIPDASGTLAVNATGNIALDATGNISFTGVLPVGSGGTGTSAVPTNGQVLIGNGSGYTLSTLTQGSGVVITNGSGTITISAPGSGSCSTCANTALSNLSGVALNTSLLPGAATIDLGSNTSPFRDLYLGGTATNNFRFTGSATASRTITVPDATGTLAVSASGNLALSATGNLSFTGVLPVGNGGTGTSATPANGKLLIGNGSSYTAANLTSSDSTIVVTNGAGTIDLSAPGAGTCSACVSLQATTPGVAQTGNINVSGTIIAGTFSGSGANLTSLNGSNISSGTVGVSRGGTGLGSYTTGDLLYASGATTLSKLADVATGSCLVSGGVGVAPAWSACPGASGVSSLNSLNGALTIANASTAGSTITINDATTAAKGIASFNSSYFSVSSGAVSLANTTVTAGSYGDATHVGTFTVDAQGRLSAASNVAITGLNQCSSCAPGSGGNYIAKNAADTSAASTTGSLIGLSNTNTGAAGVLSLTDAGTSAALSVTQSANPTAGQALILANNTNASPSGNLIDLQIGGTSKFSVDASGAVTTSGTINGATLSGGTLSGGAVSGGTLTATAVNGVTTANITVQGNTFNGASQLVQLDGSSALPAVSGANLTSLNGSNISSGTVGVSRGGTGLGSYTTGDLLYASGATTLSKLADVATGSCLVSGGVGVAPAWSACPGASGVSSLNSLNGALTIANASTAGSTITINDATTAAKGIASFNSSYFSVSSGAVSLANTTVTAGSYGDATHVGTFTVDAQGRLSAASNVAITGLNQCSGCIQQVPANTGQNTIAPTASNVVGLTVNGTTNATPATALNVIQSGNATALSVSGSGTGNIATLSTSNASANGASLALQSGSSSQYALNVTSNNGGSPIQDLYVRADGNVGIGTSSPNNTLDVNGTIGVATLGANTSPVALCRNSSNQISSCGINSAGVTLQQAYDASSSPQITLDSSPGAGGLLVRDNATPLGASLLAVQNNAGTSNYLTVTSTGVGIGVASPVNKLGVAGGVAIGSAYAGVSTAPTDGAIIQGSVGIGTTSPTAPLTVQASNAAALGSSIVTSQDFTTSNWTNCNGGAGGWTGATSPTFRTTHNTGNTTACVSASGNFSVTSGVTYQVTFTLAGNTSDINTMQVGLGGTTSTIVFGQTGSHTQVVNITAASTGAGALTFTPTTNFNGTISSVLVQAITPSNSVETLLNSAGTTGLEVRSGGSTLNNTFLGVMAGQSDIAGGTSNVAIGYQGLQGNTTGSNNTAIGFTALQNNTTGNYNTASGYDALLNNTTGSFNAAGGALALQNNITGSLNTAFGVSALKNNTTGNSNTATGNTALFANTDGVANTAFGLSALQGNTTGSFNTAIGTSAGLSPVVASNNTFLGASADYTNQPGALAAAAASGSSLNIGTYYYRVTYLISGSGETALGASTQVTTTSGNQNVNLTSIPTYSGSYNVTARKIYRTKTADNPTSGTGPFYLLTTINDNTTTTFSDTTADGSLGAATSGASGSIAIGSGASLLSSGQLVVGSTTASISQAFIGNGITAASPQSTTLYATSGSGTNIQGANFTLAAGVGTGSANGGQLLFQTASPGASGTTINTLTTRMVIDTNGNVGIGTSSPTATLHVVSAAGANGGTGTNATTALTVVGGAGGNSSTASTAGGTGGAISLTSGAGGNSTGVAGTNGANITLQGGAGGTGTTTGSYGNIIMQSSGGNVGIGTTTPNTSLDVVGANGINVQPVLNQDGEFALKGRYFGAPGQGIGVPYVVPTGPTANQYIAFDLATKGNPANVPGLGVSWIDITDSNEATIAADLYQTLRLGKNLSGYGYIDLAQGDGTNTDNGVNLSGQSLVLQEYAGDVSVGTTAPSGLFQVGQTSHGFGTVTTNGTATLTGTNTQFTNTFKVGDTINVSGETARTVTAIASDTSLTVNSAFSTSSSGHTYTLTSGTRFTVQGNGNVGIGVTNPGATLQVAGPNQAAGLGLAASQVLSVTGGAGGSGAASQNGGTGSTVSITSGAGGAGGTGGSAANGGNGGNITIQTGTGGAAGTSGIAGSYGNIILQSSGGNVGIGTSSPTYKLQVATTDGNAGYFDNTTAGQVQLYLHNGNNYNANWQMSGAGAVTLGSGIGGTNTAFLQGSGQGVIGSNGTLNAYGDQESMVPNAGFEINTGIVAATVGDGWGESSPGNSTFAANTTSPAQGAYAQDITSSTSVGIVTSSCVPITGGRTYNLYATVKGSVATTQGLYIKLHTFTTKANCIANTSATDYTTAGANNNAVTTSYTDYGGSITPASTQLWADVELENSLPNVTSTFTFDSVRLIPAQLTSGVDLAENYRAATPLTAGDVVEIAPNQPASNGQTDNQPYVEKSTGAYSDTSIGIISTSPAITLGSGVASPVPVALNGRVPVKIAPSSGTIQPGDYLTASATPGMAMKATRAGRVIGKALEAYDPLNPPADGKIMIFVNPGYADPNSVGSDPNTDIQGNTANFNNLNVTGQGKFGSLVVTGTTTTKDLVVTGTATISKLIVTNVEITASLTVNGHIITGNASGSTSVAAGVAANCSAVGTVTISGNDSSGTVTIVTPATGTCSAGTLATITFASPYGATPRIVFSAANQDAASLQYYNGSALTTSFTLDTGNAAKPGKTYKLNYLVEQ